MKWSPGTIILCTVGILLISIAALLYFTDTSAQGFYYTRFTGRRVNGVIDFKLPLLAGAFLLCGLFLPERLAEKFNSHAFFNVFSWIVLLLFIGFIVMVIRFYIARLS